MATRLVELREGEGRGSLRELDDRFLVLDFQAGDEEPAFEELHRRYSGLARHICMRVLGNQDDAEEALQETMLRVYQGLARFNGRYMVQPWVARIATNVSLDVVRARSRRPVVHTPVDAADERVVEVADREPESVLERKLEQAQVKAALDALPPHHRRALVMREFEGRSHDDIARALDITPKQAKALIHRAKGSFRRVWEGERHGLAALVPILLAPLRLPESVRRAVLGSAGQAAAAGTAAGPLTTSVATAGERVTAAAVCLAMATTVGVGAVALRERIDRNPQPVRKPTPQVSVVQPTPAPAVPVVAKVVPRPSDQAPSAQHAKKKHRGDSATQPAATVSDTASPSPSVSPSSSPSPGATATTPPPPPPAPDWSMTFGAMGKTASLSLLDSQVTGTAGKNILFSQAANGTLGMSNPIAVHAEYWGAADGPTGPASLWLFLDTARGRYSYVGSASLQSIVSPADGTTTYTYSGSFVLNASPSTDGSVPAKIPHDGTFELSLGFWQDNTSLYVSALSLSASTEDAQ